MVRTKLYVVQLAGFFFFVRWLVFAARGHFRKAVLLYSYTLGTYQPTSHANIDEPPLPELRHFFPLLLKPLVLHRGPR